jgi:hypothetical protein
LDEANFLGSSPQVGMQLPQELADQLADDVAPAPADGIMLPEGWIRLPGGIIMKKSTALLLGLCIALVMVWWYKNKKKK